MPDPSDLPLVPAAQSASNVDAYLDAAEASLMAGPLDEESTGDQPAEPLGRTPQFDFARGRFVTAGGSPVYVSGIEALAQRCMMVVFTERYVHPIYSDAFGMEDREGPIGQVADVAEAMADWSDHLTEAVEALDGVAALEDVLVEFDEDEQAVVLRGATVILDDEYASKYQLGPITAVSIT